jgi:hypothetical protein
MYVIHFPLELSSEVISCFNNHTANYAVHTHRNTYMLTCKVVAEEFCDLNGNWSILIILGKFFSYQIS